MKRGVYIFWSIFVAVAIFRVWQSFGIEPPDIGSCVKENVQGVGIVNDEPSSTETGQVLIVSVQSLNIVNAETTVATSKRASASTSPSIPISPSSNRLKTCAADFLIRLKTKLYPRFSFGDQVSFKGKLLQPVNFDSGGDRSFDYIGYLAKDEIYFEMKSAVVAKISDVDDSNDSSDNASDTIKVQENNNVAIPLNAGIRNVTDKFGGNTLDSHIRGNDTKRSWFHRFFQDILTSITSLLYSLKRNFVNNLERALGEPHAALASGLVVGEKAALGKDLLNDFRTVGLIHIVVLSGYNITVVAEAMRRVLSFLPRVWGITVGGIGIALFGILVGGGATVVRSCLMAAIALFASIIRRDYSVTNALIFAALLMLIQNPMILLHDPSFQLSFLATLGLILLASPIENRLGFITEKFGIRGIVASTIATQIFVSPYILYMMGQISIIGMLVNILVLPFIPLTMLMVFLTGLFGMIWVPLSYFFGWGSHLLLSYELFMVENFAKMPFASAHIEVFSFWWVVGFYAVFFLVYGRKRIIGVAKPTDPFATEKETKKPDRLLDIFEEFQNLPKSSLIDNPNDLIPTNFDVLTISRLLNARFESILFTRRTLKHLAEKAKEGRRLLDLIPNAFTEIHFVCKDNSSGRFLVVRSFIMNRPRRFHIVVVEHKGNGCLIIVTSFFTDEKYLKNFEILWRTGGSQS
jgi:ComEC/Rec2-related protein